MSETNRTMPNHDLLARLRRALAYRFSLKHDQADDAEIDTAIRAGVAFKGTNLWVLILAIFIASIGLNVNSTAVVIGAMLISPLMGPIIGIGYGAGINDFGLIRKAAKNLGIAALLGLMTSTLYFLISPLSSAQSELLARTTPTIWDVLIAFFGGLAGMVAVTRKEKSNVIPGVAIATALMPPLCTAGYGLATGSAHYFFGAFYLFFLNSVFIAVATIMLVAYMHLPHKQFISGEIEKKVHRTILAIVLLTLLPSIYLAYGLVTAEVFQEKANRFIAAELAFDSTFVAKQEISSKNRQIDISLAGEKLTEEQLQRIAGKLQNYGLDKAKLVMHQGGASSQDLASLRAGLLKDLLGSSQQTIAEKEQRIDELEKALSLVSAEHGEQQKIARELQAQYPAITHIVLAKAPKWEADGSTKSSVLIVRVASKRPLRIEDRHRIRKWLKVRTGVEEVSLIIE